LRQKEKNRIKRTCLNYTFRKMDIDNVGREEEVCTAATMMVIHVQRAPAEAEELVGNVEVLADIAEQEPELQESLGQLVSNMRAKGTLANYNTA
jgi:hypothetical protein